MMRGEKRDYTINCGDYEIFNGSEFSQRGSFIKTKLCKLKVKNY